MSEAELPRVLLTRCEKQGAVWILAARYKDEGFTWWSAKPTLDTVRSTCQHEFGLWRDFLLVVPDALCEALGVTERAPLDLRDSVEDKFDLEDLDNPRWALLELE